MRILLHINHIIADTKLLSVFITLKIYIVYLSIFSINIFRIIIGSGMIKMSKGTSIPFSKYLNARYEFI